MLGMPKDMMGHMVNRIDTGPVSLGLLVIG